MNKEASRGNQSKEIWPLDVLFHSVLHFCEKEILLNMDQNLPPLIHKKLFIHVLYQIRVRISRLYVVYKWSLKKKRVIQNPDYKNSYISRLQLSLDGLKMIYSRIHNSFKKKLNLSIEAFLIPKEDLLIPQADLPYECFRRITFAKKLHKSVTKALFHHNKLTIFSENKFQFTVKIKKSIRLKSFHIFCYKDVNAEEIFKTIAQNLNQILKNSSNPIYYCCDFLETVYMNLRYAHFCKTLISYQGIHKFSITSNSNSVVLNFYNLNLRFSLMMLQSGIYIFSHNQEAKIRRCIEKVDDAPFILSKIQTKGILFLFSQFQKYIKQWLINESYSTFIDEEHLYFYLLLFDKPITKISFNSEYELYCQHPKFLESLMIRNPELFFDFIKSIEIRIIAESTGFLNLALYDEIAFKKSLIQVKRNHISSKLLNFLGPTNHFLKDLYMGDSNTLLRFKQIIMTTTRSIIYKNLYQELFQHYINSLVTDKGVIITTESYGQVFFKIDKNGYWSIKFSQSKILQNLNMDVMFQGQILYTRFSGWIYNLIKSFTTNAIMIDQAFYQFKVNRSISVFHVIQKTALFFKSVCPTLKMISYPTSPITLNLQPIQFVGHVHHYDVFETTTCLPTINLHFTNHPSLDFCVANAIENDEIIQSFGSFLYFLLPTFPHIFQIFQGSDWRIIDINVRGTFSLIYHSKYILFFHQQAKNSFNVTIPLAGKSIIFNIPLSIFPFYVSRRSGMDDSGEEVRNHQTIRISMSDLVRFRDSILIFFEEQKFLKNIGCNVMIYDSRFNIIKSNTIISFGNSINMSFSLGPDGLSFNILNDVISPVNYTFKKLISLNYSNRKNRLKVFRFLFDCFSIDKQTGAGLFQSLQFLVENDAANIDWERSFLSSSVDIPNCLINLHLIINNNDYAIIIDSKEESAESNDADVKIFKPNGEVINQRLIDLGSWMSSLLNEDSSDKAFFEFSFL